MVVLKVYDIKSVIEKGGKTYFNDVGRVFINKNKEGKITRTMNMNIAPEVNFVLIERKKKEQKQEVETIEGF